MRSAIFITLLALAFSSKFNYGSTPDYDSLVLAVQWPNGVCASQSAICKEKLARMPKNTMSLHGLWPSLKSGKMLPQCNTGKEIPVKNDGSALFKRMEITWPSFMKTDEEFWTHEYNKHGYCYVEENHLSGYKDYFQETLDFFDKAGFETMMQNLFPDASGEVETTLNELKAKIDKAYPGLVYKMNCKGKKNHSVLTEFYFYFDKEFNPTNVKFSQGCSTTKKIYIKFE